VGFHFLLRIEQHGRADAVTAVGSVEHINVDATLTTAPKGVIVGQFLKGYRPIAQLCIHFHHGSSAG